MTRVWYLLCFVFGSGLTSSDVLRAENNLPAEPLIKGMPTANMVLVRMKRNPARTMSISGYMPNGGLSYASTDLMFPYSSMGYPGAMDMWHSPYSSHQGQAQPKAPSRDLQPPSRSDNYGGNLEESATSVPDNEPSWPEKDVLGSSNNNNNGGMTTWSIPKKNKKKQWLQKAGPATTQDEDEEEGYVKGDGGAKAQASFNAWFPIMLGVFPYGQGGAGGGEGGAPGEAAQKGSYRPSSPQYGGGGSHGGSQGSNPGPGSGPGSGSGSGSGSHSQSPFQRYYSTTVIANSVNNGKSGIASSTATAYGAGGGGGGGGGEQSQQSRYQS